MINRLLNFDMFLIYSQVHFLCKSFFWSFKYSYFLCKTFKTAWILYVCAFHLFQSHLLIPISIGLFLNIICLNLLKFESFFNITLVKILIIHFKSSLLLNYFFHDYSLLHVYYLNSRKLFKLLPYNFSNTNGPLISAKLKVQNNLPKSI